MSDGSIEAEQAHEAWEDGERASEAISEISMLYPPDSEYADTAEIGKQDMIEALAQEWRSLPTAVLQAMARRMRARDLSGV